MILLLTLCLTACSDNTGDEKSGHSTPDVSNSKTAFNEQPTVPSPDRPDSSLGGTYWTAVKHESYNEAFDRTEVSQMPTERWWADLFLNEDGTAQFREVLGDSFQDYLGDATWWLGVDNTLRLASVDDGDSNEMNGRIEDECIILESIYGDRFYFEKAERPGPGGELCIANLHGTWKMAKSVVGCWYETQIRFCTGEPVWADNGSLLEWVTDEILYDETIKINEPKWFSLTIPEGVPNICLHVKRPWDDFWYLWPIADTDVYLNGDWIFLTP